MPISHAVLSPRIEVIDTDHARASRIIGCVSTLSTYSVLTDGGNVECVGSSSLDGGFGVITLCTLLDNLSITALEAPVGSLARLYQQVIRGEGSGDLGPLLLWGPYERRAVEMETERVYGVSILSLPGVGYHYVNPNTETEDPVDGIVDAFRRLATAWPCRPGPDWKRRKRNQLLASGIFHQLRSTIRPLLHSLNSPIAGHLPGIGAVESLALLCNVADQLLWLRSSSAENQDGQFARVATRLNTPSLNREYVAAVLQDINQLVVWWEALLAWSGIAQVVSKEQALHILSADDERQIRTLIESAVRDPDFRAQLARKTGQGWRVVFHQLDNDDDPADVIGILKRRTLLRADRASGSEVVVLQDISLGDDPDRGKTSIRRLRSNYPWIHIVAVTVRERIRFDLLDAGADAYICKRDLAVEVPSSREPEAKLQDTAIAVLAETIGGLLYPGTVLQLGGTSIGGSRAFRLLCSRYRLRPDPVLIAGASLDQLWERIETHSPPRLLIIGWDAQVADGTRSNVGLVRELCTIFPDLIVLLAAPPLEARDRSGADSKSSRWIEHWRRWIPDFPLRVIPMEQALDGQLRYPEGTMVTVMGSEAFPLTAQQLAAFDTMIRVGEMPTQMASFRFLIPLSLKQNANEPDPDLQVEVMRLARRISEHYGGSSAHEIHGRWLDENGNECRDINLSIEAIAPATHSNRNFAEHLVNEIRTGLEQYAVLQIESPVAMVVREAIPEEALSESLCNANGVVDGGELLRIYQGALSVGSSLNEAG